MTNPIVYHNALKANGLNFNIEISTPHASQANIGNTAKIAQVFAAVVSSHCGVDSIDQLSAEQIADIELQYDHATNKYTIISQGAEKPADLRIRDAFKNAIDPADTAFASTDWKKDKDDLSAWHAIKTIIELQTSASVSGNISASSAGSALGTVASAAGKAVGLVGTVLDYGVARPVKWLYEKRPRRETVDDVLKNVPKPDRVKYFREIDMFWEMGTDPTDAETEKFYSRLIAAIKREVTGPANIKRRFVEATEAIIGEKNIPPELPDKLR